MKDLENITSKDDGVLLRASFWVSNKFPILARTPLVTHAWGNFLPGEKQKRIAESRRENPIRYTINGVYANLILFNIPKVYAGFELLKKSNFYCDNFADCAHDLLSPALFGWAALSITEAVGRRVYAGITGKPIAQLSFEFGWSVKDYLAGKFSKAKNYLINSFKK